MDIFPSKQPRWLEQNHDNESLNQIPNGASLKNTHTVNHLSGVAA
jgi:hypothetical protein